MTTEPLDPRTRPLLLLSQLLDQFDVSRATARRGIESGRFPGAHKDAQGRWLVPVDDVIAAGIKPRKTWLNEHAHQGGHLAHNEHAQGAQNGSDPLQIKVASELAHAPNELAHEHAHELAQRDARIAQLEAERDAEKQLREAAERNAEDLRTAMRMLEAAPAKAERPAPATSTEAGRPRWRDLLKRRR